jgi:large subunit ribosomal protein L24e
MRCTFCGKTIEKGTGKIYVKKDGRIFNFCSSKCEKNQLKLGRKSANVKWTEHHGIGKLKGSAKVKKKTSKKKKKKKK